MPLLELWKTKTGELETKSLSQIIGIAGKGKLQDGSECSAEFRELLSYVPIKTLRRFMDDCLTSKFEDSGLALQDVINQAGVRLGFRVIDGMYRGRQGKIGNDGLWHDEGAFSIIVEVKTTDAYRIDLSVLAKYRLALEEQKIVDSRKTSILIIVGRQDTGDLEAQIRGSKHGWDIRLISADSLFRLLTVKEETDDPRTHRKIAEVLRPQEFTKVDGIVDLLFATTEDVQIADEDELSDQSDEGNERQQTETTEKRKFNPAAFHQQCATVLEKVLDTKLVKKSRSAYTSPLEDVMCNISVSRAYKKTSRPGFWFAFHPHQADRLKPISRAYVAFGCGSAHEIICIPFKDFEPWLIGMNQTELEERAYWHVQIFNDEGKWMLRRKQGFEHVDISKYFVTSAQ